MLIKTPFLGVFFLCLMSVLDCILGSSVLVSVNTGLEKLLLKLGLLDQQLLKFVLQYRVLVSTKWFLSLTSCIDLTVDTLFLIQKLRVILGDIFLIKRD